ncbi:hypothetical protein LWI29_029533 [Acer saccharum]|uniref:Uncharacterized protein n=1 Tax=Acer saccharum TaxID=4024 RepID=A0AA39W2Q7_ACESA|nr:hypothetical protein LWI29_029533 [Acer saccharum]
MESKIKRSARGTKGSVRGSMCWCRPVHDQLRCTWTQPRASMHREVVEEFYARKNLDEFLKGGPVMVRGKEVQLEVVHINSYFDTKLPDDPELLAEMHDGVLWDNLYARQRVDFANDLVIVP